MKVKYVLDEIQLEASHRVTKHINVDRYELLEILSQELNTLSGLINWDWALKWIDPVIKTTTGQSEYDLPENFPDNFIFGGEPGGTEHLCKLDNGTAESFLTHQSPAQFFSNNYTAVSNSTPHHYTVMTRPAGGKFLKLYPPPDSNDDAHYTIKGLYVPTDVGITEEDEILPLPGNSPILRNQVLARYFRGRNDSAMNYFESKAFENLKNLRYMQARSKRIRMQPRLGYYGSNDFGLVR